MTPAKAVSDARHALSALQTELMALAMHIGSTAACGCFQAR